MKIEYDEDADALYISLRKGRYKISEEISDDVIMDLDKNCRILGVEVLGVSSKIEENVLRKMLKAEKLILKVRT
jgi:uncharacterized protein YuzE